MKGNCFEASQYFLSFHFQNKNSSNQNRIAIDQNEVTPIKIEEN